jgi:hypothetical protein
MSETKETKYGKYIVSEVKPKKDAPWDPKTRADEFITMPRLDDDILKGAFYYESGWTLPAFAKNTHGESHSHDFDEVLGFFGSDTKNPNDLCALAEVHIGGEIHTVTKSCLIFVPKGVPHGPIIFKKIDRPMFHFSVGSAKNYF